MITHSSLQRDRSILPYFYMHVDRYISSVPLLLCRPLSLQAAQRGDLLRCCTPIVTNILQAQISKVQQSAPQHKRTCMHSLSHALAYPLFACLPLAHAIKNLRHTCPLQSEARNPHRRTPTLTQHTTTTSSKADMQSRSAINLRRATITRDKILALLLNLACPFHSHRLPWVLPFIRTKISFRDPCL